ncbi:MAG TPA: hypothetical protein VKU42_08225, partial [Candidatus Angelobacter sp.]|nr:hypothetical protein [Candidatus Angelobacter sp.]
MFLRIIAATLLVVMTGLRTGAQNAATPKLRPEMLVTTSWLAEHLQDPDLVVLCIGSTPEFCKEHIPSARPIRLDEIAVTSNGIPNELPPVEKLQRVFSTAGMSNSSRVVLYGERFNLMA